MMGSRAVRSLLAALVAVTAVACADSSPTASESALDAAAFGLQAEAALDLATQQGTPLPSLDNLLRRTYQAIREQGGHQKGQRLLRAGQTLQGIIAVLGPEVAAQALRSVAGALEGLETRFAGRTLPDRMQRTIARAQTLAEQGQAAWDAGNPTGALRAALASADLIRTLSPRFQAREAIDRASRAFQAARELVGDSPTEAEKATLAKAHRFRNAAVAAFEAKKFRKAWEYAGKSLALSRSILEGGNGG